MPKRSARQAVLLIHGVGEQRPMQALRRYTRNLTDEAYKTFGFDASTFSQTSIYFVGEPRTYGGTLNITF